MTIWQHDEYYNTTTWQYDNMTIRQHDNTKTWQYDNLATRQHNITTTWKHDIMTTWLYNKMKTRQRDNMTMSQHENNNMLFSKNNHNTTSWQPKWPQDRRMTWKSFFLSLHTLSLCDFYVITSNLFDHRNLFELSEFWLYSMSSVTTGACSTLVPTTCLESSSSSTAAPLAAFMGNISHCRWQKGE